MKHGNQLALDSCPYCNVTKPLLLKQWETTTVNHAQLNKQYWSIFRCHSCGNLTMARSPEDHEHEITDIWPKPNIVPEELPYRAREYLAQAIASQHAPAGAIMLSASAIDAMLKDKGLKEGNLSRRIDEAAATHLITSEMASWAHEIRLDANDQRHADEEAELPSASDACKVIEFANALAQFLYVLPARVERGRKS